MKKIVVFLLILVLSLHNVYAEEEKIIEDLIEVNNKIITVTIKGNGVHIKNDEVVMGLNSEDILVLSEKLIELYKKSFKKDFFATAKQTKREIQAHIYAEKMVSLLNKSFNLNKQEFPLLKPSVRREMNCFFLFK